MKKISILFILIVVALISFSFSSEKVAGDALPGYSGTQSCVCHASTHTTPWKSTLHAQIHMQPSPTTIRPPWTGSVSMGAAFGNATVSLSIVGSTYKATINPSSGAPVTYDIVYAYGSGWKQRYLVKIGLSFYMIPIQYNMAGYKNNSSGTWAVYNAANWLNADGTLKAINNAFRKTSYDKDCGACHMTGYKVTKNVTGADTSWVGSWANSNDTTNNKVGCESCHGPGSDHNAAPTKLNIYGPLRMSQSGLQRQQEVCGQCHMRGSSTAFNYGYPYKESVDSAYQPGLVLNNFIAPWMNYPNTIGGPGVWPDTMTARQHRQQWQDMSYSAHNNLMNCYKCHEPHRLTANRHQLKLSSDSNSVCIQCHTNFGTPGNPNISAITQHTKHSYDPLNANQTGGTSRCVTCHMTKTAVNALAYDYTSHNWRVVRPVKTLQKLNVSSPTQGMINSCSYPCHRNPSSAGGTGNVPNLGVGTDLTLTNWRQPTDSALADTLNRWFNRQNWVIGIQNISTEVPEKYELRQNYPNPFNPSTMIEFSIPKSQVVSVKIYDVIGREVYNLLNMDLKAGTYKIDWLGINNFGDDVSSGVYFYRITAGDYVQAKKMILVR